MSAGSNGERDIMRRHDQRSNGFAPEECGTQMNGIKSPEFGRLGLRGSIEDDRVDLDHLEGIESLE